MKIGNVKVVGLGGIGSCLLPILLRYLAYRDGSCGSITLIDGDRFEPGNNSRQVFDKLGNKARVTVARFERIFTDLQLRAEPQYVTSANADQLIAEGDIVFAGVDTHAVRRLLSDRVAQLRDAVLISGGNEYRDGNAQIYWRRSGKNVTLPLANQFHLEIVHPEDVNPGENSCSAEVRSDPQLILANNAAATCMLNALYALEQGTLDYDEVYFDVLTGSVRTERRPRPKRRSHGG